MSFVYQSKNTLASEEDVEKLSELGYKQELYRGMNVLMTFSTSFTAVAVISSLIPLYPTAIATGGPAVVLWSWIGVCVLTIMTGLSMSEIGSKFPSAGSVYYWSAVMGSRFVGYVDGWFNLMGNSAADAFFASSFATFINAILFIAGTDQLTNNQQVALSTGVLAYWSLYNLLRVDIQGYINYLGAFWQFGSTAAVILTMYISCERSISQTTLGEMFTETYNGTSIESFGYVVLIGTLSAFYSFTGYEAAGHLSEETLDAEKSVPKGILYTCAATGFIGFCFLLSLVSLTASDIDTFLNNGSGVFGIFQQCVNSNAALALAIVMSINLLFSGMSSLTVTVRMAYALARDNGIPFSTQIKHVHEFNQVPGWAVLTTFLMGEILILLQLISSNAFIAVTSISTIGFQISYAIPIILRLTTYRNHFQPSYFSLGKFAIPCGIVSIVSLVFTSCLFLLPVSFPVDATNFNYTPVVFVATALIAWLYWITHARTHYISPHLHEKEVSI